jgi:hypothetical protein
MREEQQPVALACFGDSSNLVGSTTRLLKCLQHLKMPGLNLMARRCASTWLES